MTTKPIMNSRSCRIIVMIASLLTLAGAASAQVPVLLPVPGNLPQTVRDSLSKQAAGLEQQLGALKSRNATFVAKAQGILEGSPEEAECRKEQAALETDKQRYIRDANAFNTAVNAATAAAASGPSKTKLDGLSDQITQVIEKDREQYESQLRKLKGELDHLPPPPVPAGPRRIHEGLILGLFDPDKESPAEYAAASSPFTGRKYDSQNIFATTDSKGASEAIRGLVDNHYMGAYTLATPYGKQLVEKLQGTHFDRLVAHSNGATIAEALIRQGTITVDELNIAGGDRSLLNRYGLQALIDSGRVKRVVVWVNPGDIVPVGSSCALLSPLGPTGSVPLAGTAEHFAHVLMGDRVGGDEGVQYRSLSGSQYAEGQTMRLDKTFFAAHGLSAYINNMKTYLSGQKTPVQEKQ